MIRKETTRQIRARRIAFTLMELMIVVAIIVVLAGMGGVFFFGQLTDAKIGIAQAQAKSLHNSCELYISKYEKVPDSLQELVDCDPPILSDPKAINDPWGKPYEVHKNANDTFYIQTTSPKGDTITSMRKK